MKKSHDSTAYLELADYIINGGSMAKKKGKKAVPVVKKKKDKDIVVKIDSLTGRIPMSTRSGAVIQGEKYKKKKERKQWKQKLKGYMGENEDI